METGYPTFLAKALEGLGPVDTQGGGSGYFSAPEDHLDPRLFHDTTLRPQVRVWILRTLYGFWATRYHSPQAWSTAWLAGSGISYQWAADRSNGDLDVLIGVDFPAFYAANPDFVGLSEQELGDRFNDEFRQHLWTTTDQTLIGTQGEVNSTDIGDFTGVFEVTFYVNPNSADIRNINPYAAYDVTHNRWTVPPPELPEKPGSLYPQQYWDHVYAEKKVANGLVSKYNQLSDQLHTQVPSSPQWLNSLHGMGLIVDQAKALFDDIHLGRKRAFGPDGQGYGDFYNFRWQAHKRFGTIQALSSLGRAKRAAKDSMETEMYGKPIDDPTRALTKAALWNTPYRDQT